MSPTPTRLGKTPEILVVDDQDKNLQLLGSTLTRAGYDVVFASNGQDAMLALQAWVPDLVLLDVMMPGVDGYEVCRWMKTQEPLARVPIIFLTARTDSEDIVRGFDLGAQDYITKPFKAAELLARVRTHLRLQESLRQTAEYSRRLEDINANQKKFFSIVSHDLRGPLYVTSSLLDILAEDLDGLSRQEQGEVIDNARRNIASLAELMEDLLSWGKLQMDEAIFSPQDIVVHDCVRAVVALFELPAMAKGVRLHHEIESGLLAQGDFKMISTVLRNLVGNALKFTPSGGRVCVQVAAVGDRVRFAVEDTGVGMSEERVAALFRMDVKQSTPGTDSERGSGLGLLLCRALIEKHGSTLVVRSEEGKGSTFSFDLPFSDPMFTI